MRKSQDGKSDEEVRVASGGSWEQENGWRNVMCPSFLVPLRTVSPEEKKTVRFLLKLWLCAMCNFIILFFM